MVLISSSTASYSVESSPNRGLSPNECSKYKVECICYGPDQLDRIYADLIGHKKCLAELEEKNEYIKKEVIVAPTLPPAELNWWQEPEAIFAGLVVSVSVSSLLTFYFLKKD